MFLSQEVVMCHMVDSKGYFAANMGFLEIQVDILTTSTKEGGFKELGALWGLLKTSYTSQKIQHVADPCTEYIYLVLTLYITKLFMLVGKWYDLLLSIYDILISDLNSEIMHIHRFCFFAYIPVHT